MGLAVLDKMISFQVYASQSLEIRIVRSVATYWNDTEFKNRNWEKTFGRWEREFNEPKHKEGLVEWLKLSQPD